MELFAEFLSAGAIAFASLFTVVGPIGVGMIYSSITPHYSAKEKRALAFKSTLIATCLLLVSLFGGEFFFKYMGISLPALRTAGGILLLIMSIDLVTARHSGSVSTTDEEQEEALERDDLSVFPLAMPLMAGPGAIGLVILLHANSRGDVIAEGALVAALLAIMLLTLICMLLATPIQKVLGATGLNVINRIMGVVLAALAVQFIFDGIANSGLLSG